MKYLRSKGPVRYRVGDATYQFDQTALVSGTWWSIFATEDAGLAAELLKNKTVIEITEETFLQYQAQKKTLAGGQPVPVQTPARSTPAQAAVSAQAARIANLPPAPPPQKKAAELDLADLDLSVPVDMREKSEAREVEDAPPIPGETHVKNHELLAAALGLSVDEIKGLAKIDGAPARNPRKGFPIEEWRKHAAQFTTVT